MMNTYHTGCAAYSITCDLKSSKPEGDYMTQEELKDLVIYDKDTGVFTSKVYTGRRHPGVVLGTVCSSGYVVFRLGKVMVRAHRMAYLYIEGYIPEVVDHINGNKKDNTWSNLKASCPKRNAQNRLVGSNNTSGHLGVYFDTRKNKWKANIQINYKQKHLGYFFSLEDAITARVLAEREYFF